jgi:phage shock protein PspC (stress-responsive transcriptional regulator)
MDRTLFAICVVVAVFVGFQLGFAIPAFVQAGVFSERKEKGVESKIDPALERHYRSLYEQDE